MLPHHVKQGLANEPSYKRNHMIHLASGSRTLLLSESGATCTNKGSTGAVTYNLPSSPKLGAAYRFVVHTAQELRVNPGDAHAMIVSGGTGSVGNYWGANDEGEHMIAEWDGTAWLCTVSGTWTEET